MNLASKQSLVARDLIAVAKQLLSESNSTIVRSCRDSLDELPRLRGLNSKLESSYVVTVCGRIVCFAESDDQVAELCVKTYI